MLCFFRQLTPPSYLTTSPGATGDDTAVYFRNLGRELDLSPWFNGPCVIVIGHLRGRGSADSPPRGRRQAGRHGRLAGRGQVRIPAGDPPHPKAFEEAFRVDEDDDDNAVEKDENEKIDGAAP